MVGPKGRNNKKRLVLSGSSVFKGKILLDVRVDKIALPNGRTVSIESIKHPGAACIVPFLAPDKVILIRQYRAVIDKYIWEAPAGTLKTGEVPLQCARRELEEETGYGAKSFRMVGAVYTTPGFSNEIIYIYKAASLQKTAAVPEDDEIISARTFTTGELKRMFRGGEIVDSKTISGLAMCGII